LSLALSTNISDVEESGGDDELNHLPCDRKLLQKNISEKDNYN
jgi:hypothetical protein